MGRRTKSGDEDESVPHDAQGLASGIGAPAVKTLRGTKRTERFRAPGLCRLPQTHFHIMKRCATVRGDLVGAGESVDTLTVGVA